MATVLHFKTKRKRKKRETAGFFFLSGEMRATGEAKKNFGENSKQKEGEVSSPTLPRLFSLRPSQVKLTCTNIHVTSTLSS